MNNRIVLYFLFISLFAVSPASYGQETWIGKDSNIRNADTRGMAIDAGGLYLATKNEIYRARSAEGAWEAIFALPSGENEINCLAARDRSILIGTRRGILRSQDYGNNWRNVFRTMIPEKSNVVAIMMSGSGTKNVLMATEKGVFLSKDMGNSWKDIAGSLKNRRIRCIALNKDSVYAGGEEGLYFKENSGAEWERIYTLSAAEKTTEEIADYSYVEEEGITAVSCIALKGSRIYIGTGKNILYSDDGGRSWRNFTCEGLTGNINHILTSDRSDSIYCATTKGVFEFDREKKRWFELYKGMNKASSIHRIIFNGDDESSLWALTGKGLYKLESGKYMPDQYMDVERDLRSLKIIFDNEPSFKELQHAAMKFAEVDPDKIKRWRNEARLRALLPKVSVGMDKDRSNNSEIYTSATRDYYVVGPDDESSSLDFSISWELGDIIWSDDQTNIDVRSRLTTQLRNDILDDLRRVYYERKRLQFEMVNSPPENIKARFEKELRIQELTQAIDDLTGNYFSEHMKKK